MGEISRREFLRQTAGLTAVAAGSASLLGQWAAPAEGATTLVTTTFGGSYGDTLRKYIAEPFEKKTGARVTFKLGTPAEWLTNAKVNRARPEINLLLLFYPQNIQAILEGIGIELKEDDIPNLKKVYPQFYQGLQRRAVAQNYASYVLVYRTDRVKERPTSWMELWKPQYKGRLTLPDIQVGGGPELLVIAAKIHGGSEKNIDPGFEALKRLRPNVRKYSRSVVEVMALVERGEADMGLAVDLRVWPMAERGVPVAMVRPKEGVAPGLATFHIPENTPNMELCKQYVNHALSEEVQFNLGMSQGAGTVNREVRLKSPVAERVVKVEELMDIDHFTVVKNISAWTERWNREVAL